MAEKEQIIGAEYKSETRGKGDWKKRPDGSRRIKETGRLRREEQ